MSETAATRREASPNVVLAMLLLVYTFNFLDRQILSILKPTLKAEFGVLNMTAPQTLSRMRRVTV